MSRREGADGYETQRNLLKLPEAGVRVRPGRSVVTRPPELGWEHRQLRAALLPLAYGKECPFCGYAMVEGQKLDLDHSVMRVFGGGGPSRMAHAHCNRRMGGLVGNRIRWGGRRAVKRSRW